VKWSQGLRITEKVPTRYNVTVSVHCLSCFCLCLRDTLCAFKLRLEWRRYHWNTPWYPLPPAPKFTISNYTFHRHPLKWKRSYLDLQPLGNTLISRFYSPLLRLSWIYIIQNDSVCTSQRTVWAPIRKKNRWILCKEPIAVCCKSLTKKKKINSLRG
jgi:hypothetical protein